MQDNSINLKLAFWGVFKDSFEKDSMVLAKGSNLSDLIALLKQDDAKQVLEYKGIYACAINGELITDYKRVLNDQDRVDILPPVTGG